MFSPFFVPFVHGFLMVFRPPKFWVAMAICRRKPCITFSWRAAPRMPFAWHRSLPRGEMVYEYV